MESLPIDLDAVNYISTDEESFFIYRGEKQDQCILLRDRCPHRGGPLHLGQVVEQDGKMFIRCPWHQTKTPLKGYESDSVRLVQLSAKEARLDYDPVTLPKHSIRLEHHALFPDEPPLID